MKSIDDSLDIPIRVNRYGKWQALMINELDYITDAEIDRLLWRDTLLELLGVSPYWRYDSNDKCWRRDR